MSIASVFEAVRSTTVLPRMPESRDHPVIGTHDGSFHCDEATAIGMLKILPRYAQSTVVRTRKEDLLAQCDIVVDVGAKYIPETHRYDHHQREFTGTLDGYKTRLSSAGLVYKHFGKEIIAELLNRFEVSADSDFVNKLYEKLYVEFVEHLDAIDNGVSVSDGPLKYFITTTLSARVGKLNPAWNEPNTTEVFNDRFKEAMELTSSEFISHAEGLVKGWWPARSIVVDALKAASTVHPSGSIVLLPTACPWKDHLFEVEEELGCVGKALYIVFGDSSGSWRVQAVPEDSHSFENRTALPEAWRGLRDNVLSEKLIIFFKYFILFVQYLFFLPLSDLSSRLHFHSR